MEFTVDDKAVFAATGGRPFDPALPSIVFVHGAALDHTVWALQTRYFAHHGRNVLAVDLPGHGRSAGPPFDAMADMADWVVRVLDEQSTGVSGIPVEIRDQTGVLAAAGVSDGAGNLPVVLDEYAVSTVGVNLEEIADTLYANPHDIRAILATGAVSQSWEARTPYFVVSLITDGSGGGISVEPPVVDPTHMFRVVITTPAPGAAIINRMAASANAGHPGDRGSRPFMSLLLVLCVPPSSAGAPLTTTAVR